MNEIETKRKELRKYPDLLFRFNEGVEMARKEFLDFLEEQVYFSKEGVAFFNADAKGIIHVSNIIGRKIRELKQSLGEI